MRQIFPLAAILLFITLGTVSACSSSPDAGAEKDAGAKVDVGAEKDAGAKEDAGAEKDAGSARDGGGAAVISGKVSTTSVAGQTSPVVGATVEILGASPANSTITAAEGSYSLTVVPGTYYVRTSKDGMISAQLGVVTSQQTDGVDFGMQSRTSVNLTTSFLGISLDSSKGIVVVGFETSDTGGGYSATLTAGGDSFAISSPASNGLPQKSAKTFAGAPNALVFTNVSTGTTKVSFVGPSGHLCSAKLPIESYRVDADVITGISSTCN